MSSPSTRLFFRHTATASNPDLDESQKQRVSTRGRRLPAQAVKTLNPHHIQATDFIDVSDITKSRVRVGSHLATIRYGARHTRTATDGRTKDIRFPLNTHGFLYYHHDPKLPPTMGEIRFRLTPHADPAQFQNGEDLTGYHGGPWAINILMLTKPFYEPLKKHLLDEGLLDSSFMWSVQEAWAGSKFQANVNAVHYAEQPFVLDLSGTGYLRIFTPQVMGRARIHSLFMDQRDLKCTLPYSGRILARLEPSTLPEHAGTRAIVIRVLEILQPIKVVLPGYDMRLPIPKKGGLLETYNISGTLRPYSINLDRPPKVMKDIALLFPKCASATS
ncbi:hypothetical protein FPV67DRAFT_1409949 [Lyophyllum atratum]|nr:hypothetical protein FPV67DRAFT_1409949 [Lyophyllum atratum]